MQTKMLIQAHMNMQSISFCDELNGKPTTIKRVVVYASSISQQEVCKYFLASISREIDLEFGEIEPCICYFESQELMRTKDCRIDNYWIDGSIYLMTDKNKNEFSLIVLGDGLGKNILSNMIKEQEQLAHVDQLENCWIKRQGNELSMIRPIEY